MGVGPDSPDELSCEVEELEPGPASLLVLRRACSSPDRKSPHKRPGKPLDEAAGFDSSLRLPRWRPLFWRRTQDLPWTQGPLHLKYT